MKNAFLDRGGEHLRRIFGRQLPHKFFSSSVGNPRGLIVLLSGAGGWLPFVKQLSKRLSTAGLDVLGFDSLLYFFYRQKTPQELADDLDVAIKKKLCRPGHENIIFIGYSQGADVLPFALNRLSKELRERIKLIVLIGIAKQADFRITLTDLVTGQYGRNAMGTHSEILKIHEIPILCIYGENDSSTLSRDLKGGYMECVEIKGGHMFLTNWPEIADLVLKKINTVLGGRKKHEDATIF